MNHALKSKIILAAAAGLLAAADSTALLSTAAHTPGSAGACDPVYAYMEDLPDAGTLSAGYIHQVFHSGQNTASLKSFHTGSRLAGQNKLLYYALKAEIQKVAAGQRSSTKISVPAAVLLQQLTFTPAELGLSGSFTDTQVKEALSRKYDLSLNLVLNALLADCPYELYWYRKSEPTLLFLPEYQTDDSRIILAQDAAVTIQFPVDSAYAGAAPFTVDTAKTGSAVKAAENAKSILAAAAGKSDYEKLDFYRSRILDLVSYDTDASASSQSRGPWQLVHVFDGIPSTNVVCEGYAKAFQYLCDETDFSNPHIRSYLVHGSIRLNNHTGSHMWNLIDTGSGGCYLVDLTNCDTGAVGADDKLFLAGCTSGSPKNGYTVRITADLPGSSIPAGVTVDIIYTYDPDVLNIFSESMLTLAPGGKLTEQQLAASPAPAHNYNASFFWSKNYSQCTAELTCGNDPAHVIPVSCSVTSKITKPASGSEKGTICYTAECNYKGRTYRDTKNIETDDTGPADSSGTTQVLAVPDGDAEITVTIRKKNDGSAADVSAAVSKTVPDTGTAVLAGSTVSKIITAAGQKNVPVTMTCRNAAGSTRLKLLLNAKDLTAGKKLFLYEAAADGSYHMVNAKTYPVSRTGGISVSLSADRIAPGRTYQLVTKSEAAEINKKIKDSIALRRTSAVLKKGGSVSARLDSRFSMADAQSITYTSSNKTVAAVSKTGKVTAKKAGTAVIKIKVNLRNGSSKTVSMKIKVRS